MITNDRKRISLAVLALVVGITLFCVKFYAYWLTQSQAIYSDALESIVNVTTAVVALIVVIYSSKPRDADHPYGHGKIEFFAAGFEGVAILVAGVLIIYESLPAMFFAREIQQINQGLILVTLAGLINGGVGLILVTRGKLLHSPALTSDGHHLLSDFYTSMGVLIGLALVKVTGLLWIDPLIACLLGLQLSWHGGKILLSAGQNLMDAEDESLLKTLEVLFNKHAFPGIIRIHDTRVMRSGRHHHIDLHTVVPEFWTIEKAHDETNKFEALVNADYPLQSEFHFHLDPCKRAYCQACDLPNCLVRKEPFEKRIDFTLKELKSREEIPLKDTNN